MCATRFIFAGLVMSMTLKLPGNFPIGWCGGDQAALVAAWQRAHDFTIEGFATPLFAGWQYIAAGGEVFGNL